MSEEESLSNAFLKDSAGGWSSSKTSLLDKTLSVGAVETLGGEEMLDERVALSFSRKTSVSISALWTAWKLGDVKSADEMEGGKWGMMLPEGLSGPMTPKR